MIPFVVTPQQTANALNWSDNPLILSLPMGDLDPRPIDASSGSRKWAPKRHVDPFSRFCTVGYISHCDQHTGTQTTLSATCAATGRIACIVCMPCGLIIVSISRIWVICSNSLGFKSDIISYTSRACFCNLNEKVSYCRETAQCKVSKIASASKSCYASRGMGVKKVSNSKTDLQGSLATVPFDRPHTSMAAMLLSCTVSKILSPIPTRHLKCLVSPTGNIWLGKI